MKKPNAQVAIELVFVVLFLLVVATIIYFAFDQVSGGMLSELVRG